MARHRTRRIHTLMSTYEVEILETVYRVHHIEADSEEEALDTYWETDPVKQKEVEYEILEITKIQLPLGSKAPRRKLFNHPNSEYRD